MSESNLEELRTFVAQLIKEHKPISGRELERMADQGVVYLTRLVAYNFVKRISYAVGHPILEQTYKDVLREEGENRTSIRLVDLSVRLDHFLGFPEEDVLEMWEQLKGQRNFFSGTILRDLVATYLYLSYLDEPIRQRLAAKLEFDTHAAVMMEEGSKKLPRPGR